MFNCTSFFITNILLNVSKYVSLLHIFPHGNSMMNTFYFAQMKFIQNPSKWKLGVEERKLYNALPSKRYWELHPRWSEIEYACIESFLGWNTAFTLNTRNKMKFYCSNLIFFSFGLPINRWMKFYGFTI